MSLPCRKSTGSILESSVYLVDAHGEVHRTNALTIIPVFSSERRRPKARPVGLDDGGTLMHFAKPFVTQMDIGLVRVTPIHVDTTRPCGIVDTQ